MNREELEGVIGHEMSHIKNYDVRLLLIVSTLSGGRPPRQRRLARRSSCRPRPQPRPASCS